MRLFGLEAFSQEFSEYCNNILRTFAYIVERARKYCVAFWENLNSESCKTENTYIEFRIMSCIQKQKTKTIQNNLKQRFASQRLCIERPRAQWNSKFHYIFTQLRISLVYIIYIISDAQRFYQRRSGDKHISCSAHRMTNTRAQQSLYLSQGSQRKSSLAPSSRRANKYLL